YDSHDCGHKRLHHTACQLSEGTHSHTGRTHSDATNSTHYRADGVKDRTHASNNSEHTCHGRADSAEGTHTCCDKRSKSSSCLSESATEISTEAADYTTKVGKVRTYPLKTTGKRPRNGSHAVTSEQTHDSHVFTHAASRKLGMATYQSATVANGVTHHPHVNTGSVSHVLKWLSDSGSAVADVETHDPHVHADNICHILEHAANSLGSVGNSANTFFNTACDSSKALSHIASEEVDLVNRRKRRRAHSGSRAVIHALKNLVQASCLATCGLSEVPALVDCVGDFSSDSPENSRKSGRAH